MHRGRQYLPDRRRYSYCERHAKDPLSLLQLKKNEISNEEGRSRSMGLPITSSTDHHVQPCCQYFESWHSNSIHDITKREYDNPSFMRLPWVWITSAFPPVLYSFGFKLFTKLWVSVFELAKIKAAPESWVILTHEVNTVEFKDLK